MFSALRQGNMLYVLRKGDKPELVIATITATSDPVPKFGQTPVYGQQMQTTVNITAKADDNTLTFEKLDSNATLMTYPNENTVVASSREAMNGEVEAMLRTSRQIVDSVPYHKRVLESYDGIYKKLNPQFAREKEREEKINALESRVGNVEQGIGDIKGMLAKLLDK